MSAESATPLSTIGVCQCTEGVYPGLQDPNVLPPVFCPPCLGGTRYSGFLLDPCSNLELKSADSAQNLRGLPWEMGGAWGLLDHVSL